MKYVNIKLLIHIILILLSFPLSGVFAQTTIGADVEPNKGALLDLKEYEPDVDNATAKKGLAISRVNLTNLTPASDTELAQSIGAGGSYPMLALVGMVIYNIGADGVPDPCDDSNPINKGLYVWHGDRWEQLYENNSLGGDADGVLIFTDQEGRDFKARKFGSAGVWMVQNLAVTSYASNIVSPPLLSNHTGGTGFADAQYVYPSVSFSVGQPAGWVRKHGLLYNWTAASGNYSSSNINQMQSTTLSSAPGTNEVEMDANTGTKDSNGYYYIQGICPEGWHLPSDREWNALEKEIYNNTGLYSYYTASDLNDFNPVSPSPGWNSNWEISFPDKISLRGSDSEKGHGLAMLGQCSMPGAPTPVYQGQSLSAGEGGFDVMMTGSIYNGAVNNYGATVQFWTSSVYSANEAYTRFLEYNISGGYQSVTNTYGARVRRDYPAHDYLHPVRCKKND